MNIKAKTLIKMLRMSRKDGEIAEFSVRSVNIKGNSVAKRTSCQIEIAHALCIQNAGHAVY